MTTKRVKLATSEEAVKLLGQQDKLLRQMEQDFGVEMFLRQDGDTGELQLSIKGASARVDKAVKRIRHQISAARDASSEMGQMLRRDMKEGKPKKPGEGKPSGEKGAPTGEPGGKK